MNKLIERANHMRIHNKLIAGFTYDEAVTLVRQEGAPDTFEILLSLFRPHWVPVNPARLR